MNRVLGGFAKWFASAAGVWQTFAVTALLVFLEFLFPRWDPDHFLFLYWCTVYSAVTQPALAYVAVQADNKSESMLKHLEKLVERGVELDEEELQVIKNILGK